MKRLVLLMALCASIGYADTPASQPAEKHTLLSGKVEYTSPADWIASEKNMTEEQAFFIWKDRHSQMHLLVLPKDIATNDQAAVAILRHIRQERKKPGFKVSKEAKIEKDSRFDIRIYEEFEKDGHAVAQLRLYRHRGPRPFHLTLTTVDADDEAKKELIEASEETLLSAKWVKK